jgi:hypothetical protein
MKSYALISKNYLSAHGLTRCQIRNSVGEFLPYFLTQAEIKTYRQRGVNVLIP